MPNSSFDHLRKARTRLLFDQPFFAAILLKKEIRETNRVPTAAVDGWGNIYVNPAFVQGLSVEEVVFLLAHEVMHVVGQHAARLNGRNHALWNIAADAWINDVLRASKVGNFIQGGVDMPGSQHEIVDDIYDRLLQQQQCDQSQRGAESAPGPEDEPRDVGQTKSRPQEGDEGANGPGGIGSDLLDEGPRTEEERRQVEAETKIMVAQAAKVAAQAGKFPAALRDFVSEILYPRTPWFEVLERHMLSFVQEGYSWARPNRRYATSGHYLPSYGKEPRMGEMVIQVDVSGSIGDDMIAQFTGHMQRIVEQCRPEKVHLFFTDTRVASHVEIQDESDWDYGRVPRTGGGTDMPAGFAYCAERGIEPHAFVCLTDGETDFGKGPGYPVFWVMPQSVATPPHGVHVAL